MFNISVFDGFDLLSSLHPWLIVAVWRPHPVGTQQYIPIAYYVATFSQVLTPSTPMLQLKSEKTKIIHHAMLPKIKTVQHIILSPTTPAYMYMYKEKNYGPSQVVYPTKFYLKKKKKRLKKAIVEHP